MDVIYSYTRKQAIEDGVLRDLTDLAREEGIRVPVAVTEAVWHGCFEVPNFLPEEDQNGRTRALLSAVYCSIMACPFASKMQMRIVGLDAPYRQDDVTLDVVVGPGDELEPVITVMFPGED